MSGRMKRPGGTVDPEWTLRINLFFERNPRLTTRGVAYVLSDMARTEGGKTVTFNALATYRSRSKNRRPPDYFQDLWERMERQAGQLGDGLAVLHEGGQHMLAKLDSETVTVWVPPSARWAIHECSYCHVHFVGQHNARCCLRCKEGCG